MEHKYYCTHCKVILEESKTEPATISVNPYNPAKAVELPYRVCKKDSGVVIPIPLEQ